MSKKSDTFKIGINPLKDIPEDSDIRFAEIQRERAIMDSLFLVQMARRAIEKNKEKGRAKGQAEGLEKGMQKGIQKGMQKGTQAVALNMLKKQMELSVISEVTGLTKKEIKNLQNNSN